MKMRQCFVILLSVCFLCGAFTGTASASKWGSIIGSILGGTGSNSSAEYKPYHIEGKVINQEQIPLSGIKVEVQSDVGKSWSTHTDANGNYQLNIIRRDTSHTTYIKFTVTGDEWRTLHSAWDAYPNDKRLIYNIQLHHDYITGKVTDRYGNPMHWAKLSFEADGGTKGVVTAVTDENGNYKATIPVDDVYYWVIVSQDGYKTIRTRQALCGECVRNYTLYEE